MADQDSRADIQITFDDMTGDVATFRPGERVSGQLEFTAHQKIEARKAAIQLRWFTHGKGDTDQGIVAEQPVLVQGAFESGQTIRESFSFDLPQEPWSYAGHYVNIAWSVHFMIDVPMVSDVHYDARFVMHPDVKR